MMTVVILMDRMTRARVRKTCMVTPSWRTSTKLSSCIFLMEGILSEVKLKNTVLMGLFDYSRNTREP